MPQLTCLSFGDQCCSGNESNVQSLSTSTEGNRTNAKTRTTQFFSKMMTKFTKHNYLSLKGISFSFSFSFSHLFNCSFYNHSLCLRQLIDLPELTNLIFEGNGQFISTKSVAVRNLPKLHSISFPSQSFMEAVLEATSKMCICMEG